MIDNNIRRDSTFWEDQISNKKKKTNNMTEATRRLSPDINKDKDESEGTASSISEEEEIVSSIIGTPCSSKCLNDKTTTTETTKQEEDSEKTTTTAIDTLRRTSEKWNLMIKKKMDEKKTKNKDKFANNHRSKNVAIDEEVVEDTTNSYNSNYNDVATNLKSFKASLTNEQQNAFAKVIASIHGELESVIQLDKIQELPSTKEGEAEMVITGTTTKTKNAKEKENDDDDLGTLNQELNDLRTQLEASQAAIIHLEWQNKRGNSNNRNNTNKMMGKRSMKLKKGARLLNLALMKNQKGTTAAAAAEKKIKTKKIPLFSKTLTEDKMFWWPLIELD